MEIDTNTQVTLVQDQVTSLHELEMPYSAGKKKIALRKFKQNIEAFQVNAEGSLSKGSSHQCQVEFYELSEGGETYLLQHVLPMPFITTTKLHPSSWCRNEVFFFSKMKDENGTWQYAIQIIEQDSYEITKIELDRKCQMTAQLDAYGYWYEQRHHI